MQLNDDELDVYCEEDDDGYWIARIYHRVSHTIKISDRYLIKQEAIDEARKGLLELLAEKKKGLGH